MTWGPQLKYLLGLKAEGMDPPALKNRPVLDAKLDYFRRAFLQITPSRGKTAQGHPRPLTLRSFLDYFEMFYVTSITEREHHLKMFQALDEVYVRIVGDKVDAEITAEQQRQRSAK